MGCQNPFSQRFIICYQGNVWPRSDLSCWKHQKKVCVTNFFQDITFDVYYPCYTMCFTSFAITNVNSTKSLSKLGNKIGDDAEDSPVQGPKDTEIEYISKKIWRRKENVVKRKNPLVHNLKVVLILLLKNLSHPKIEIAR